MVDITVEEITNTGLDGVGYFDKFMSSVNSHLQDQYDKHRIKSSEYASVYLGAMQTSLTEAIKFAVGKQLASAQADLAIIQASKVVIDKNLVQAEIDNKNADTANKITDNSLILERIDNLEQDTLVKEQKVLQMKKQVEKVTEEIISIKSNTKLIDSRKLQTDCETNKCGQETLLVDARAKTEKANTDASVIGADSILDYKRQVIKSQLAAEKAQTDGSVIGVNSNFDYRNKKILADINNAKARYAPAGIVEANSLLDCESKLTCARVETEKANFVEIGTGAGKISPDSLLGAKAELMRAQSKTEIANLDPKDVKDGSIYKAKITKMEADANNALANYNPDEAGVKANSRLDCEARLACAKAESERANYTTIGTAPGQINPSSYLGARANLLKYQAGTEKANVDGSDVTTNSLMHHKIVKMKADANAALAQYDPSTAGVRIGSKLGCEADLLCARADTERSNIRSGIAQVGSLVKAKIDFLDAQRKSELEKKLQIEADTNLTNSKFDGTTAKNGSLIDCQAKQACSVADLNVAQHIGTPGSVLGAKLALIESQKNTEDANIATAGSGLIGARTDLLIAQTNNTKAELEDASIMPGGSLIKGKSDLVNAQASIERARLSGTGMGSGSEIYANYLLKRAQARQIQAEAEVPPANHTLMSEKIQLMHAQAAEARSKSCRAPRNGSLMSAQISLLNAQIEQYAMNGRAKKAQLIANMYSASVTQDAVKSGFVKAEQGLEASYLVTQPTASEIASYNANEDAKVKINSEYTPNYLTAPTAESAEAEAAINDDFDCSAITFSEASSGTTGGAGGNVPVGTGGYKPPPEE